MTVPARTRMLGAGGLLTAAQAFGMACGLAATAVWARLMPPELFGEFKVMMAIVTFVAAFCLLGTGQASVMSAAKNIDGNLRQLLRSKLAANVAASLALGTAAGYYAWGPGASWNLATALLAASLLFPLYNLSDVWTSWINGKGRLGELAVTRTLTAALGVVPVVAAAWTGIAELWLITVLALGGGAALSLIMVRRILRRRENAAIDASILGYGHHATAAMMFSAILTLDVVILNQVHSASDVAIYVVALQFPELIKALFSVIGQTLAPRIFGAADLEGIWLAIRRPFWIVTCGAILLGILGYLLLPSLTVWLFSDRYTSAAEYGRWLWLAVCCCGSTTLLGTALTATKKPLFVYAPFIGYPVLLGVLYLALVGDGVAGLTLARVIAVIALALFYAGAFLVCRIRASCHV